MISEHQTIIINRDAHSIFEFINDDDCLGKWVNGIVAVVPIGELKGGVGDRVRISVDIPKKMDIVSTVIEWEPDRLMKFSNDVKVMPGWIGYELKPLESGTELTFTAEHHPKGIFMRLISPLIRRMFRKERRKELERLKQVLEAG